MNYREFCEFARDHIKEFLPAKYQNAEVSLQEVLKGGDKTRIGLMVKTESNISPNVYLEEFFEEYSNGKDLEKVMKNIADFRDAHEVSQEFDVSMITDFDKAKDLIQPRLINGNTNFSYLMDKPNMSLPGGIVEMFAVKLGNGMSSPVTEQMMESWGVSAGDLHDLAQHNQPQSLDEVYFKPLGEVLCELQGIPFDSPQGEFFLNQAPSMYVLSNNERTHGASLITNSELMDEIADKIGPDFKVVPSSIHECLILPADSIDREAMEEMIHSINEGEVLPEERLSDSLFIYDNDTHGLVTAWDIENYNNIDRDLEVQLRVLVENPDMKLLFSAPAIDGVTGRKQELCLIGGRDNNGEEFYEFGPVIALNSPSGPGVNNCGTLQGLKETLTQRLDSAYFTKSEKEVFRSFIEVLDGVDLFRDQELDAEPPIWDDQVGYEPTEEQVLISNLNDTFKDAYDKFGENRMDGGLSYKEALDIGDALINARNPIVEYLIDTRGDFFTSDREVAALGYSYKKYEAEIKKFNEQEPDVEKERPSVSVDPDIDL